MDNLNGSFYNNKNIIFKESQELMNRIIQTEKEIKRINDYMLICDDARKKSELLINSKPVDPYISDLREIDNKIGDIIMDIDVIK